MASDPTILAFDTSVAHCAAALLSGGRIVSNRHEEMTKGQAERLMGLLAETLEDGKATWRDLDAIGVGTGPGNFTGIRISVSAARGLALGLGQPAIGVGLFDALAFGAGDPLVLSLGAPRQHLYVQTRQGGAVSGIVLCTLDDLPDGPPGATCIGHRSDEIASRLGLASRPAAQPPAAAIALLAAERLARGGDIPRPAPVYLRPADAAPPRDAPPALLP
ncbi:MAG: tRNA (adenosine(37)-N6)-threonylcarbamoyltransferase complex dimerization subunit type 1 TsaB [Paracoccaceae bacterium]